MVSQDRAHTRQAYLALSEQYPDKRLELIDGVIIEKMPTQLHAYIVHRLSGFLFMFLREHRLGYALVDAHYSLPYDAENVRVPDLSFISAEKGPLQDSGPAPYMPDWAVEVQSPGQSARLMADKAAFYLANGSRLVWLVYPSKRLVEALTPTERHLWLGDDDLHGGDVLPGFRVQVHDLFPDE